MRLDKCELWTSTSERKDAEEEERIDVYEMLESINEGLLRDDCNDLEKMRRV